MAFASNVEEKWGPGHKCLAQVSINVVEELLEALEEGEDTDTAVTEDSVEFEGVLAIGDHSDKPQLKRKTMRLSGVVEKKWRS